MCHDGTALTYMRIICCLGLNTRQGERVVQIKHEVRGEEK